MRPALRYRRACFASAYRFCVAQPCPRLHEAFHLERVTARSGRQQSGSHLRGSPMFRGWGGHTPDIKATSWAAQIVFFQEAERCREWCV